MTHEPSIPALTHEELELSEGASAMLDSGMDVVQIEQCLMSKGLSAELVTTIMEHAIESRAKNQFHQAETSATAVLINRILSAIVALAYILVCRSRGGGGAAAQCAIAIALPVTCIWFGDEMGAFTGAIGIGQSVAFPTPGIMVRIGGWILLLAIGAALFLF